MPAATAAPHAAQPQFEGPRLLGPLRADQGLVQITFRSKQLIRPMRMALRSVPYHLRVDGLGGDDVIEPPALDDHAVGAGHRGHQHIIIGMITNPIGFNCVTRTLAKNTRIASG